ncbi:thioredoxin family protein [Bacillus sp. FJAT-28004]|jgi:thiol-disulfide isomerase/thioredoxin|uniref:thioredoxin family protein n=1 Tax=Bacillus sp. FJAT-28004 TaxID=1679165 RepID=UPI0006B400DB|nr:thioredoxin family protein [Bacillus sp. FJAT-28004]
MAIQEIQEEDWLKLNRIGNGKDALLFSSPFCGTCKVAERMLEVVVAAEVPVTLYKININYAPQLRNAWKITSVPCLVLLKNGEPYQFEYAMRSVDYLYTLMKSMD